MTRGSIPWNRDELTSRVRVIDWARDWITPSAPFERIGTDVSDAYLARLRADVVAQASPNQSVWLIPSHVATPSLCLEGS